MRTSRSLLAALITTTACAALVVPTTAALAAQGRPGTALSAFGFGTVSSGHGDDDDGDDQGGTDAGSSDDSGGGAVAATSADIAIAAHVRVRLTAFDTATITWSYTDGAEPDQVFVRLVPGRGDALSSTVEGDVRSTVITGLAASTRYRLTIASVAADGSSPVPVHSSGVRTVTERAALREARAVAKRAAHAAKVARKLALRAAHRARIADGDDRAVAMADAAEARGHADRAARTALTAKQTVSRAKHGVEAAEHGGDDD